jgi:ketosteroid isomerase-like protein
MNDETQSAQAVRATLDRYSVLYAAHDVDGIMGLFAPDPDIVVIGTGADEKCVGPAQVRQLFERNFAESETDGVEERPR